MDNFKKTVAPLLSQWPRDIYELRYSEDMNNWIAGNKKGCFLAIKFEEAELEKLAESLLVLDGEKLDQLALKDIIFNERANEIVLIMALPGSPCLTVVTSPFADARILCYVFATIIQRVGAGAEKGLRLCCGLPELSYYNPTTGKFTIDPYGRATKVSPHTFTTTGEQKLIRKAQILGKIRGLNKLINGRMAFQSFYLRQNRDALQKEIDGMAASKSPAQVEAHIFAMGGLRSLGFGQAALEFIKNEKSVPLFVERFNRQFREHIQLLVGEFGVEANLLVELILLTAVGDMKHADKIIANIIGNLGDSWGAHLYTFDRIFETANIQSSPVAIGWMDASMGPCVVPFLDFTKEMGINAADALAMCQQHGAAEAPIMLAYDNLGGSVVESFVLFYRNLYKDPVEEESFAIWASSLDPTKDLVGTLCRAISQRTGQSYGLMIALPILRLAFDEGGHTDTAQFLRSIRALGYAKFRQSIDPAKVKQLSSPAIEAVLENFLKGSKGK